MDDDLVPADATEARVRVSVAALAVELHVSADGVQDIVTGLVQSGLFEHADVEPLLSQDVASTVRVIVAETLRAGHGRADRCRHAHGRTGPCAPHGGS